MMRYKIKTYQTGVTSILNAIIFSNVSVSVCVCLHLSTVPYDDAPAVCRRPLQPVELHELPTLAVHRHRGAWFNLPSFYQARPPTSL